MAVPTGMKKIFWILTILLLIGKTQAQMAVLQGVVRNAANDQSIPGVTVFVSNGTGMVTDSTGSYRIEIVPGKYTVKYSMLGFRPMEQNVELNSSEVKIINVDLHEDNQELDIVVISAGKFEQDLGEVTVSMEVLKPDLLQNKNTTSMENILQQAPGVSIVDGEPQIRSGSGYSFGAGSRVQILVDDLPMLSGDAGRPSWGFLPVENVHQVEVIKGASSVLYGSSALSGVINLRTAFPGTTPQTRITVFHGFFSDPQSDSAKYWSSTAQQSGVTFLHSRQIKQWDLVVGGNFLGDDSPLGPIVDSTGNFNDGKYDPFSIDRYEAELKGRLNANIRYRFPNVRGLSAGVNTNWSKNEGLAALLWENSSSGLYKAFDGSATRTKQLIGTVDPYIQYHTEKGISHSLRTRWQHLENDNDNNQGNFSDVLYAEYQFQMNFDSLGIQNLNITSGLVSIDTKAAGDLFTGGNDDGKNTAGNKAVYLQADKKFFKKLNVSAGIRYEQFNINDEKESKPVFRSGINYQIAKATYMRASFGQGFRFPSIAEKFIVTDVGAIVIFPNPDIESESSVNMEIGIKQGWKVGKLMGFLDVSAFDQRFENYVEFTFGQWKIPGAFTAEALQESIGFKSVNTGKAKVTGVDVSLIGQGKIGATEINMLAGYTFSKPVSLTPDDVYAISPVPADHPLSADNFDTLTYHNTSSDPGGNILKYRMQHLVRIDVEAKYKKLAVGASFRSNSHMQNIDLIFEQLETYYPSVFNTGLLEWRKNHTKGDYIFDFRISWQITSKQKVSLIVNNVLNREYAIRPLAIEDPRLTTVQYVISF